MTKPLVIVYSNLGLGGIPVRITDIVNRLKFSHNNTPVYILLKEKRDFDLRDVINNPNVRILDFYRWNGSDNYFLFMLWAWYHIFLIKPATIASHISPYSLTVLATKFIFFWRKVTIIINEGHYTSTMVRTMVLPWVQELGIRLLYPYADRIIVPTTAIQLDLIRSYGIPLRTIQIIPNWSRYADCKLSKKVKRIDIIYAGRLEKEKQIFQLLTLLRTVIRLSKKKIICMLVGEGSEKDACMQYIRHHKLEHNIFITTPLKDISLLLKQSKCFVCNSTAKSEGFPVSILDAFSTGALVVTKYFYGLDTKMNNTYGYIAKNDSEMTRVLIRALDSYEDEMGKILLAKSMVKQNYSTRNINEYIKLYNL